MTSRQIAETTIQNGPDVQSSQRFSTPVYCELSAAWPSWNSAAIATTANNWMPRNG